MGGQAYAAVTSKPIFRAMATTPNNNNQKNKANQKGIRNGDITQRRT